MSIAQLDGALMLSERSSSAARWCGSVQSCWLHRWCRSSLCHITSLGLQFRKNQNPAQVRRTTHLSWTWSWRDPKIRPL